MRSCVSFVACAVSAVTLMAGSARADVKLAVLFSDHMVLQRDARIPVWGTADASEQVNVTLNGKSASAVTDAAGHWRVNLDPLPAGGPFVLTAKGKNSLTVNDVLIGDVWLCSGQSNMQFAMGWHKDLYAADIAASSDPKLRCFTLVNQTASQPLEHLKTFPQQKWLAANPQNLLGFTAVGYYFAREVRKETGVPIGLIHSSWGGTPGESWVSRLGLSKDADLKKMADTEIHAMESRPEDEKKFPGLMAQWEQKNSAVDQGNTGDSQGWAKPEFDDHDWKTAPVPLMFGQLGMKSGGAIWFRKTVDLPASAAGKNFVWRLGWSPDHYIAYFNGVQLTPPVSQTPEPPTFYNTGRAFQVPGTLVRAGKNTLAIRDFAHTDHGVLGSTTEKMGVPMAVFAADANTWRYKIEFENPPLTAVAVNELPKAPSAELQYTASYIYNAMIAPVIPFAIRGTIWYQGESNAQRAAEYRKLLPALIADWRARWGEGDFPFYIVQLANFGAVQPLPGRSGWAELREAQSLTAKHVPNTGIAVIIDTGEADNIHPVNKVDVGKRLALVALADTYGKNVIHVGPEFQSMKIEGDQARLTFAHADGGLVAKGGALKYFAIAGEDKKFVWADARIDGDTVIVTTPKVPRPVAVRYAWADNPQGCNLYNGAGLPASPFRTDDWTQ